MKNLDEKMEKITGVKSVREKVDELESKIEERSFAYDLLTEFKALNKRMFVIIIILIGVLIASNFYWLYTFTQYDFETYDFTTEGGGNANYIGNDGDIINGENENPIKDEEKRQE